MELMTITYKLEPRDLRAFQSCALKHLQNIRRTRYFYAVVIVGCSLSLTLSLDDHRIGLRLVYFCTLVLVFSGLMRLSIFLAMRLLQWRSFTSDKQRSVLCEHTMTLADDGLVEVTPFNEARNLWKGIYQIVDTRDYIYIFTSFNSAHIIPKRAFPDAESSRRYYERAVSLQSSAKPAA
jgi:hypothetical protein